MFLFDVIGRPYRDPWNTSFYERLSGLKKGGRRVAYFYECPDSSTFRYRVYNMMQAVTASEEEIAASYFTKEDLGYAHDIVQAADVIVVCRFRYCAEINALITLARNMGKRVFFDIDDLVFDVNHTHLVLNSLDADVANPEALDTWFAYFGRIGATLKLCDAVITTNHYLADQIQNFSGKEVHVIPNFLNREQISISREIFDAKKEKNFRRSNTLELGYFSGTPTHNKDFEIVVDALVHLLENDSRTRLVIVGFLEINSQLARFANRIRNTGLIDFMRLQELIGKVEINLVPLQDNTFTNCKSNLKYFEAAAVGTISIATPTVTYSEAIVDGENGFLATSYGWVEKIETILGEMECYPMMAQKAFTDAMLRYSWQAQISTVIETLFGGIESGFKTS